MSIIFLLIFFCDLSSTTSYDDKTLDITVYDNTIEVDRLLYGNIIKMDDLYLPDPNKIDNFDDLSESYIKAQIKKENVNNPVWNLDDLNFPNAKKWQDIKDFNEITKSVRNITKNATHLRPGPRTRRYWYQDREDGTDEYYAWKFYRETDKKNRLINLMTTFLIHARFQIKKVITSKHRIRRDKRYRLGFLFNKLKHLHYEQTKLVNAAHKQIAYKNQDLRSLIKIYEKVIRSDVDIIDTVSFIKSVDLEPDNPISLYPKDVTE